MFPCTLPPYPSIKLFKAWRAEPPGLGGAARRIELLPENLQSAQPARQLAESRSVGLQPGGFRYVEVQPSYAPLWQAAQQPEYRVLLLRGGAGSGKSYAAAELCLLRLLVPGTRSLVCRKYASQLARSVVELCRRRAEQLALGPLVFRPNPPELHDPRSGSSLLFTGVDEPEKLKSIEGITHVWMEEATEFDEQDFQQLNLRLRARAPEAWPGNLLLTFNPVSSRHWLYRRFYQSPAKKFGDGRTCSSPLQDDLPPAPQVFRLRTTYRDNPALDPATRAAYQQMEAEGGGWAQVYARGEWGQQAGRIFPPFRQAAMPAGAQLMAYGLDFGFHAPTALLAVYQHDHQYYLRELLYEVGLTQADLLARLEALSLAPTTPLYADSAEPARIQDLERAGYNAQPAAKRVRDGLDHLLALQPRLYLVPGQCPNLETELADYCWQTDRHGAPLEEPRKQNDHALDALRYALYTHHLHHAPDNRLSAWSLGF